MFLGHRIFRNITIKLEELFFRDYQIEYFIFFQSHCLLSNGEESISSLYIRFWSFPEELQRNVLKICCSEPFFFITINLNIHLCTLIWRDKLITYFSSNSNLYIELILANFRFWIKTFNVTISRISEVHKWAKNISDYFK